MRIVDLYASPGLTGFFFDDQRAIKGTAREDGFAYEGEAQTPGFSAIRQKGESISLILHLEDGQMAYGDCAAVQYSGAGGRDPLFLAKDFLPVIEEIREYLAGREMGSFRSLMAAMERGDFTTHKLHRALQYGVSQVLLDGVARMKKTTMAQVLMEEYDLPMIAQPIPIFAQTGDERYSNVDKMIIKEVDVLPHGLINHVGKKLGHRGEKLLDYIRWIKGRVEAIGTEGYCPIFHFDVYGTPGLAFHGNLQTIRDFLLEVEEVAWPHKVRIEGPVDVEEREKQIEVLAALTASLDEQGSSLEIVADEWCNTLEDIQAFVNARAGHMVQVKTPDLGGIHNTVEAILYCKEKGIGAYQGGTCNETDRSAQICVHAALAARPDQMLAKPGMGVDEGLMVVQNEMNRTLTLLRNLESQKELSMHGTG